MKYHEPVLLEQSIDGLNIRPDGIYVDLTFGGGGHSREIIKNLTTGRLVGFDQDEDAESNAIRHERFIFILGNFRYVKNYLRNEGIYEIDGALADLGVSSHHFDVEERGFSFRFNSPLDMRMNKRAELTAKDILNTYSEDRLTRIFKEYGELKNSEKLGAAIVQYRAQGFIERVDDLLRAVDQCLPRQYQQKYLAKVFQALRIEVNDEIQALAEMLVQITGLLRKGARFVVITYHSLEDRLVKNLFRDGNIEGERKTDLYGAPELVYRIVNRNIIRPNETEIEMNPRARSAKLRIAERI